MMEMGFPISQVAELVGCSHNTLRRWEKEKLIPPPKRRNRWAWRFYTMEDVEAIKEVIRSKGGNL